MKVRESIRHDKDGRSIYFASYFRILFRKVFLLCFVVRPKFDFAKKGFRVRSFMSFHISLSLVSVLFGNNSVSARGDDKEVGNHYRKNWIWKVLVEKSGAKTTSKIEANQRPMTV
jgi:hypothetical protein